MKDAWAGCTNVLAVRLDVNLFRQLRLVASTVRFSAHANRRQLNEEGFAVG